MKTVMEWLHRLTHKHVSGTRNGVGEFQACGWRLSRGMDVWFCPEGYAATALYVPVGEGVLEVLVASTTVEEAVAVIDRAGKNRSRT